MTLSNIYKNELSSVERMSLFYDYKTLHYMTISTTEGDISFFVKKINYNTKVTSNKQFMLFETYNVNALWKLLDDKKIDKLNNRIIFASLNNVDAYNNKLIVHKNRTYSLLNPTIQNIEIDATRASKCIQFKIYFDTIASDYVTENDKDVLEVNDSQYYNEEYFVHTYLVNSQEIFESNIVINKDITKNFNIDVESKEISDKETIDKQYNEEDMIKDINEYITKGEICICCIYDKLSRAFSCEYTGIDEKFEHKIIEFEIKDISNGFYDYLYNLLCNKNNSDGKFSMSVSANTITTNKSIMLYDCNVFELYAKDEYYEKICVKIKFSYLYELNNSVIKLDNNIKYIDSKISTENTSTILVSDDITPENIAPNNIASKNILDEYMI